MEARTPIKIFEATSMKIPITGRLLVRPPIRDVKKIVTILLMTPSAPMIYKKRDAMALLL